MNELVDRVALAIAQHFRDPKTPMNEAQAVVLFSDVARKVIAEMREPTDAMLHADMDLGGYGYGDDCYPAKPCEVWRAMIDAALREKE